MQLTQTMNRFTRQKLIGRLAAAIICSAALCRADAIVIVDNGFQLDENQFRQWVYGSNRVDLNAQSEIEVAVRAVDLACGLTDEQREKLRLAGRGDFARFEERVDEMRAKYVGKMHEQNEIGRIHQEIQPLNVAYQSGLLGPSSLFAKVLAGMLTPEQLTEYAADETARVQARHEAKVKLYVAMLERRCPMTDVQRSALVELLVAETRPPTRKSSLDQYVVLVQAASIPAEKYLAILDEEQYRVVSKTFAQVRGLEQHLRQQGVLP